jgi:ligand-binding sensor domain-containing protein
MKKYYLHHPIYTLLVVLIFFTSCNGQKKTSPQKKSSKSNITQIRQPKLIKTQGSTQYDNIHCGLQDKAGNLWFGTTGEGVYRYGYQQDDTIGKEKSFIQFTEKDGLSSNTVWSILEDKEGNIWFGTANGICRYNIATSEKNITPIPIAVNEGNNLFPINPTNNTTSAKNEVFSMIQDKKGKLWFGTTDGVYCYDGIFFTRFLDNDSIVNKNRLTLKSVQCMLEDKKGNIWFGSGLKAFEGICKYDGKSITSFKPGGEEWIRYMPEDKNGIIWLGTRHKGVWHYDTHQNDSAGLQNKFIQFTEVKQLPGNSDICLAAFEDKNGNIWLSIGENDNGFGGNGGIWRYNPSASYKTNSKKFINFSTKEGLGDYSIWCMIEDNIGNIWVGTRNTGLYQYDGKSFINFTK